jgi:hypothetical protein
MNVHARAIPVMPRRGCVRRDLRKVDFGDALNRLTQNGLLQFELPFVADVLIVASAALTEVGAARTDAVRRRTENALNLRSRKTGLLFDDPGFNAFAGQGQRNEDRFTSTLRVGRKTGEAIAAINEFFDCQFQTAISPQRHRDQRLHIKKAETRQLVMFQQALVDVLLLQLIDLRSWHFATIRGEFTIGFGANRDQFVVRGRCQ